MKIQIVKKGDVKTSDKKPAPILCPWVIED